MTETWRSAQLAALLDELAMLDSLADVVERSVAIAQRDLLSVSAGAGGAVSIVVRHERIVVAPGAPRPGVRSAVLERASDPRLSEAVALQATAGAGPGYDLARGAPAVLCSDLAETELWPAWSPRAVELGWRSWFGVPLLDRREDRREELMGALMFAHPEPDVVDTELADRLADWSAYLAVAVDAVRRRESL